VVCAQAREVDGVRVPVDCTAPNPNGVEFDNLYLDMNGIVHPCTHPEDRCVAPCLRGPRAEPFCVPRPAPRDEAEMMLAIFDAVDRLVRLVRPRRLLYLAVDGVAPRAKMNQQRSRRFRAAKEALDRRQAVAQMRDALAAQGVPLPPARPPADHFDSNCITPVRLLVFPLGVSNPRRARPSCGASPSACASTCTSG